MKEKYTMKIIFLWEEYSKAYIDLLTWFGDVPGHYLEGASAQEAESDRGKNRQHVSIVCRGNCLGLHGFSQAPGKKPGIVSAKQALAEPCLLIGKNKYIENVIQK